MKITRRILIVLTLALLLLGVAWPAQAAAPTLAEIAARPDVVLADGASLNGVTGCMSSNLTARGRNTTGADGKTYWTGVLRAQINGYDTPVFCIDLLHHISAGDCFQALGQTSEEITWILNNYPADFSLSNDEAAARQAAIWYFSDGWVINSPANVAARTQAIIASVPQPLYLPLNPPSLAITPSSVVNTLPDETIAFQLTATQDGQPAAALLVDLTTTFGVLSSAQVTTDADGKASFTLSSNATGAATVTAKAHFTLPRGTELHYSGTGQRQTLVLATPVSGYVFAEANAQWQGTGTITAHKYADNNLNQTQDSGEPNLSNWTMKLYQQVSGSWVYRAQGKTNASGNYTFANLQPGVYQVREVMQSNWKNSTPLEQTVTLNEGAGLTVNFGNIQLAVVTAIKYRDDNLDGVRQSWLGEPTLDGWRMTLWKQVGSAWADQGNGYTRGGSYTFSALEPGTYRLSETMIPGWLNSTVTSYQFVLAAGETKTLSFGNIEDICELSGPSLVEVGATATLVPRSGFASYEWQISGGSIIENNGATIVWQAPAAPGTYTIEVNATTLGGAVQNCQIQVIAAQRPTVSVNDAAFCQGESGVLTAVTNAAQPSYKWSNGATTASITVNETGSYSVTVTDGQTGLSNTASGIVTVYDLPTVSVNSVTTYEGDVVTLTAQTNATSPSFLWSNGATTPSIQVTEAGVYTVRVTDGETGCPAEASGEVRLYTTPSVSLDLSGAEFCMPGSTTLRAETTAQRPSYHWSTGATTSSIVVTQPGSYQVTVSDALTGWTGSASAVVKGYPSPVADFEGDAPVYEGQVLHLTNLSTVSDGAALSYWWDFGDGQTSTEVNPNHLYAKPGTYEILLIATRSEGCSDQIVKTITIEPLPTFSVCGYVYVEGSTAGIPGSRVEFKVKVDGRWIPAGSMTVGEDGYFSFSYTGLIEAIALDEINVEGYVSTSAAPIVGGVMVNPDALVHEGLGSGEHCAYIFYDAPLGYAPDCGCVDYTVFHTNRDGNWDLYRLSPDSHAAPINLTNSPATDIAPAIAPDGQIAFQSDRDGNWEVYVVDGMGLSPVRLTDNPADDTDPVWSPICEERRLAFQSNRDGHWEIYVSDGTPNTEWRLTESNGDSTDPFWSPDGEWVAFQSNRDGNWEVYVINVATGEERRLTDDAASDVNPSWSPDGDAIAFLSDRDGNWEIYTVDMAGAALTRVTESAGEERHVAWSPDGEWLAFQSDRAGSWNIYVIRPDGSDLRAVAPSLSTNEAPPWNCESTLLVFHSDREGHDELYRVDPFVRGAMPERLTNDPARDICPAWQPAEEDASLWGVDPLSAVLLLLAQ